MPYFANKEEVARVIGGFLEKFPDLDPLLKELSGHTPMLLKLELADPEFMAVIDLKRSPMEIQIGADSDGEVGMSGSADKFHELLLGMFPVAVGINRKTLVVRGSTSKLMQALNMFYVAPAIYPFYLESIGRDDLIKTGNGQPLHADLNVEDKMTKIISKLAWLIGYILGAIKKSIAPNLNILAILESMGQGLLKTAGKSGQETADSGQ